MAIASLDDYIASVKQNLNWTKTAGRASVAAQPFTVFDLAGQPGSGTLAIGNTANGTVPTDASAGYPVVNAFGASAKGYISRFQYASSVSCRLAVYDRLFAAGAYAFNDNITLVSQPTFASRIPSGSYTGLELWVEAVTAFTGVPSFTIGYTNSDGFTTRSTGTIAAPAALSLGRMFRLPLQAGDNGIQRIDSVQCTVATAGTFNVMILRPLVEARVPVVASGGTLDMLSTGLPEIAADAALYMVVTPDSSSTGIPSVVVEVANK